MFLINHSWLQIFQHFLEWFRSRFPYYYDRCDTCGASAKDEPALEKQQDADVISCDNDDEEEDDNGTFLGYVYPSKEELVGKASRTEIYQCHKCGSFTRFPRYNSASSIIRNRRGRCGEYSMLLYRILRATGHTCRWIVDWADHVWAEVRLNGHWIHLDPCEAAVNKPLLYEEWGKQQTYIVAFHAPLARGFEATSILNGHRRVTEAVPLIEDVTLRYTSSDQETIRKRRDESEEELRTFMDRTIVDLERKLDGILR
jgi:Transglutaminase-like superfamily